MIPGEGQAECALAQPALHTSRQTPGWAEGTRGDSLVGAGALDAAAHRTAWEWLADCHWEGVQADADSCSTLWQRLDPMTALPKPQRPIVGGLPCKDSPKGCREPRKTESRGLGSQVAFPETCTLHLCLHRPLPRVHTSPQTQAPHTMWSHGARLTQSTWKTR